MISSKVEGGLNGYHPGKTRSTLEAQPLEGKHFQCSMCRASHLGPLFSAGPSMLFFIYVVVKYRTDAAEEA